jgi:DNA-binding MarR family transcriptional regulator
MSAMTDAPAGAEPSSEQMDGWPTGRLLSVAARMVEHAWAEVLERHHLTHAGIIALHLLGGGPLSQTELARHARVETQTMSRTIERLEREGFVVREKDARDGRRHVVTRTPAGEQAWNSTRSLEAELFPTLENPQEMRDALLGIIRASAEKRWTAGS